MPTTTDRPAVTRPPHPPEGSPPGRVLPFRPARPQPGEPSPPAARGDAGQATTEYALVLLAAAAVALLFVAWATRTGAIGDLFDAVLASIRSKV